MVVSGDGNFLQPFEELGWIDKDDSKEEKDKDEGKKADDDEDEDEDEEETKTSTKSSGKSSKYLVDDSRLSSEAKKSGTEHYYGELSLADSMADEGDEDFVDLYKLMKAGINIYAIDGKAVEIEFGFDISEFCKEAYRQFKDELTEGLGVKSADDLEKMMMGMIETSYDTFGKEYSDYISKYVDGGSLQLYVTEKGFDALYEEYDIEEGERDVEKIIDSLEEAFDTKIKLVD